MRKEMDMIQFESRYEIDEVINVLEIFKKEHPNTKEKITVEKLIRLLDLMYMEW